MSYYVRRHILIRNFKPLQIIHFLILFYEKWYKYVIFHAKFIFIHHFEKKHIVQKIMGKDSDSQPLLRKLTFWQKAIKWQLASRDF